MKLHNTLSSKTEEFAPQSDKRVSLYTCGPTVYATPHIGNWAAYIYWDTLVRTLKANDYSVERVMNITDVGHLVSDADEGEDKLEKGARREGKTAWEVAEYYTHVFTEGMARLNLLTPEHIAKATDFIPQQLDLVRTLKNKGYTYQIEDGIYYDTTKFPHYADFAHLDIEQQQAGARVAVSEGKKHPSDFALWKFTPAAQTRDMEWDTPADLMENSETRKGFPGWHLECSAIAMSLLGDTIDIHTGGIDHIPVHHTNEIAQSEAATGNIFSKYWLHCNHLKVNGTKISKSLDNGYTLDDLQEKGFSPLDYRMFILQGHYTNEGNFTFENLTAARQRLLNWRNYAALRHQTHDTLDDDDEKNDGGYTSLLAARRQLVEILSNDLATPEALRFVDETLSSLDSISLRDIHRFSLVQFIETLDELLGLRLIESTSDISDGSKRLIVERRQARERKDWSRSDELRNVLIEQGVSLRDTNNETIWSYTT